MSTITSWIRSDAKRSCQPSAEMSEIIFWMRVTHYSARWITLCEEGRRTRGYMLNSRLTEQLTDCGNLNILTEARPIPVVALGAWSVGKSRLRNAFVAVRPSDSP